MKANVEWMNVTYDVEFAAPAFDLPIKNTSILKIFYETIHPQFPINVRDMRVDGGNLLSDVRVRVTLFNGNSVIDISADKMSLVFNNLRTKEDLTICRDCIFLSEESLQKSLPDVPVRNVTIKPMLFLELQDGEQNASKHLSQLQGASLRLDLSTFGGAVQHPGVNLEVENSEEGWGAVFHAFRDQSKASALILSCYTIYRADGTLCGLENRTNHLERLLKAFLDSIDLETGDSAE